jgi:hypothetical protein
MSTIITRKNIQTALPLRRGSATYYVISLQKNVVALDPYVDHHAKIRLGPQRADNAFGEVAERLPFVAFGPQAGPSREKSEYQCVTSSMSYAAPWWRVYTLEAPLNPTRAWDRTTLGELVPTKAWRPWERVLLAT